MIASIALLVLALLFLQQNSGVGPGQFVSMFLQWPIEQKLAIVAIGAVLLFLLIAGVWQSDRLAQQAKAIDVLQRRMNGLRDELAAAEQNQGGADAAVRYLIGSDPTEAVDNLQQRLSQAEAKAAVQKGQNEAVDLQSRIDEIRQRQQALRSQLGSVSEKRRVIEPMLSELKERQTTIERSLADLEKDDSGNTLDARIKDSEGFLNKGHTRLGAIETLFDELKQIKERGEILQTDLDPLRHKETGIKALLNEVTALRNRLDAALVALGREENETIADRVARLSNSKQDIERRLAALTESFASLEAIRGDVGGHFEKLSTALESHLKRA